MANPARKLTTMHDGPGIMHSPEAAALARPCLAGNQRGRWLAAVSAVAMALCGCSAPTDAADPPGPPLEEPSAAASADPPLVLLALGDSWPYGAHCNGCVAFPYLYADGLQELGQDVDFVDLLANGGTSASLLQDISTDERYRRAVSQADVIMISTGANDLVPAFESWKAGSCGGPDGLGCFTSVAQGWKDNFDAMLDQVDELREDEPTAIRLVTNSNEFLSDPGLIELFGADFGRTGGAVITGMHHDALCAAASAHGDVCVDLRPVLNGPNLDQPQDVNTQEAMQAVADALVGSGLAELASDAG